MTFFHRLLPLVPLAVLAGAAPATAQPDPALAAPAPEQKSAVLADWSYTVAFDGFPEKDLERRARDLAQLVRLQSSKPPSLATIRRRAQADERKIRDLMQSEGYYGARVVAEVTPLPDPARAQATIRVLPGARYRFLTPALTVDDASPEASSGQPLPDALAAVTALADKPARAADALAAEEAAVDAYRRAGYPFARAGARRAVVDHARLAIVLTVAVRPGRFRTFDSLVFDGLETVDPAYLTRLRPWQPGQTFNTDLLEDYRDTLQASGLFASIRVTPADPEPDPAEAGETLPVAVSVREGAHRTIGGTIKYARDEGFGIMGTWQHRNFLGQAETLDLSADLTELEQTGSVSLAKPDFGRRGQTLRVGLEVVHADTDAFEEYSGEVTAILERPLWTHWTGHVGGTAEVARLEDVAGRRTSYLVGVPVGLRFDNTDSLLDPTRGMRLAVETTPFAGAFSGGAFFVSTTAEASGYLPLGRLSENAYGPSVVAGRVKVGSVAGQASLSLPANRRLYSGGGGSVRGYGYQRIGDFDAAGNPLGGRSVIEGAVEARLPVSAHIAVVPFVDAGMISSSQWPTFDEPVQVAAGLGARYATIAGPLRLDVAFPVNRRRGRDNSFQFYISFGQAF